MLISNFYINKSKQGAKLLFKYLVDISRWLVAKKLKQKLPISKTIPQKWSQNIIAIVLVLAVIDISSILTDLNSYKPSFTSVDLKEIKLIIKKSAEKSIIIMEKIISAIETNSKVYKPFLYKEVISNPMHAS